MRNSAGYLLICCGLWLAGCGGDALRPDGPLSIDLLSTPFDVVDEAGTALAQRSERRQLSGHLADAGGAWEASLEGIAAPSLGTLHFTLRGPAAGRFQVEVGFGEKRDERSILEYQSPGQAQLFQLRFPGHYRDPARTPLHLRIVPPAGETKAVEISAVELEQTVRTWEVRTTVEGQNRRALLLAPRAAVQWQLRVPENARLRFGAGVALPGHTPESDGSEFAVSLREDGGGWVELWRRYLAPGQRPADREWVDVDLDFGRYAGRQVELRFEARPSPARPQPFGAVEDATMDAPLFSAPVLAVVGQDRPNVLVIVIDSLRAKSLGIHGAPGDPSPRIDAFARENTIFDWAMSTAPWTLPSSASLFTGLLPHQHGVGMVRGQRTSFLPGTQQWGERFKEAGYATGAITNNQLVRPLRGFGSGIDHYDERVLEHGHNYGAERMTRYTIEWLEQHEGEPFFFYAHYFDPHWRYQAPPPHTRRFIDERLVRAVENITLRTGDLYEIRDSLAKAVRRLDTRKQADAIVAGYLEGLYRGEVHYADSAVGELLDYLAASGLLENTLVILTSDHGEEFAEHGYLGHGHTLYDELLHIPLVVRFPDGTARGERVPEPVSNRDLPATVLGYAGLPPLENPGASRHDLHALLASGKLMERGTVFASGAGPNPKQALPEHEPMQALIDWPWKFIHNIESGRYELYRLDDDPGEFRGRSAEDHARLFENLRARLQEAMIRPENWQEGVSEMTPELLEQLRALGYVQ